MHVGPGYPHNKATCNLSTFRKNQMEIMNKDKRGSEIIASTVFKQKAAESDSDSITLATPGRNLVLPKPERASRSKALLSGNTPISFEQFSKTTAALNLTGAQSKKYAQGQRILFGRKVLVPNVREKMHDTSKRLEEFFMMVGSKLDHSQSKIRKLGFKVNRHVFVCSDLKDLVLHIAEIRAFGGLENTYLKFAVDGGQKMLKFCFTIELLDSKNIEPRAKRSRSLYADGPFSEQFLNSGVKRLIICGNVEEVRIFPFYGVSIALFL